jgi:hypothetical protein
MPAGCFCGPDDEDDGSFETSYGRVIPGAVMRKVARRMSNGEDWQRVAVDELRSLIPGHDDDLDELNEVLSEVEEMNGLNY